MVVHIPKTKYWFTADEHYGHTNIIKYCNRPFKNVEEMDEKLIKRHNERVGPNDTVIHAGDFTIKKTPAEAEAYIKRLNGKHIFLRGSHEYWGNASLEQIYETEINGQDIIVCHYAMRTWPKSHYGSLLAYGHSHGKLLRFENSWDVGVDNNNFYPVSCEEFIKKAQLSTDNLLTNRKQGSKI